jgi:hypothetical protein
LAIPATARIARCRQSAAKNYGSAQVNELLGNVNRLRAPLVTIDDVPQQAKAALGDKKALELTQKLLETGLSSSVLDTWSPEVYKSLGNVFTDFANLQKCAGKCSAAAPPRSSTSSSGVTLDSDGNPALTLDTSGR